MDWQLIAVGVIIAAAVLMFVRNLLRSRRGCNCGKGSCEGPCEDCPHCRHKKQD